MSLKKRLRKKVKDYGRQALSVGAKVSRVARPLVSAAAGYFAGPAGVIAVNAVSHYGQYYQATSGARADGIRGREAREIGRKEAQRTTTYSLIAGGVGSAASGVTSLFTGGSFWGGAAAGQGGAALLGGNTIFGSVGTAATLGQVATSTAGTTGALAGVKSGWDSLYAKAPGETPATPVPGAVTWDDLVAAVAGGLGGSPGGKGDDEDGTVKRDQFGLPSFTNSPTPGGEGGEKPGWVPLAIAAMALFAIV